MIKKIVILGSGFAALTAVKKLRKLNVPAEIFVVSKEANFSYLPSVIWAPYGMRKREDLMFNLKQFFAQHGVKFIQAEVKSVSHQDKKVQTSDGSVDYDYLILATGGKFIKKAKGIKEYTITPCEGVAAGEAIKARLDTMTGGAISFGFSGNPKEPTAMRGGPMFEFMFGIDTWLRKQGTRDKFVLNFVSPAPQPGKRLGEKAVKGLLREMKKRDIKTYLGAKIVQFGADFVETENETFASDLTLFIPGMAGPDWLQDSDLPLSEGGFAKGDVTAKVVEDIYAAGDVGSFPGPDWRPKQAHMADLQAEAAAKNIHALMFDKPATHEFKTELICIVDTLDSGILVFRSGKMNIVFKCRLFHYAKIAFEKMYLRGLRS